MLRNLPAVGVLTCVIMWRTFNPLYDHEVRVCFQSTTDEVQKVIGQRREVTPLITLKSLLKIVLKGGCDMKLTVVDLPGEGSSDLDCVDTSLFSQSLPSAPGGRGRREDGGGDKTTL